VPAWLRYTLLRLVLFVVPLLVLLFLGVFWLWAALVATVVAFCLSFIFLRRQRAEVAGDWANRRPSRTKDDVAEDAEIDAAGEAPRED
jgi:fatty acid desaturase